MKTKTINLPLQHGDSWNVSVTSGTGLVRLLDRVMDAEVDINISGGVRITNITLISPVPAACVMNETIGNPVSRLPFQVGIIADGVLIDTVDIPALNCDVPVNIPVYAAVGANIARITASVTGYGYCVDTTVSGTFPLNCLLMAEVAG